MIHELQEEMLLMPQVEVETNHYFCDGVYAREMIMKKGTCIVGAKHKTSFFLTVSSGECIVCDGDDETTLKAPITIISKVGAKRAIYALEDTVLTTYHPTKKTNIKEIENDIIESEGLKIANNPQGAIE